MTAAHNDANADAKGYESDIGSSEMTSMGIYFVVLSTLFFSTLGGLYMYFRYETALAIDARIGVVESQELKAIRAADQQALGGIDAAMAAAASEYKAPTPAPAAEQPAPAVDGAPASVIPVPSSTATPVPAHPAH